MNRFDKIQQFPQSCSLGGSGLRSFTDQNYLNPAARKIAGPGRYFYASVAGAGSISNDKRRNPSRRGGKDPVGQGGISPGIAAPFYLDLQRTRAAGSFLNEVAEWSAQLLV